MYSAMCTWLITTGVNDIHAQLQLRLLCQIHYVKQQLWLTKIIIYVPVIICLLSADWARSAVGYKHRL